MGNDNSLIQQIKNDIAKTGYPTEVATAELLSQRGWKTLLAPAYRDGNEGKSREFDVRAYREYPLIQGAPGETLATYLMMECKKSDKPWVFFTTLAEGERDSDPRPGRSIQSPHGHYGNVFWTNIAGTKPVIRDDDWQTFHHYFQTNRWAHNYHEPFKNRQGSDRSVQIHTAIQSVVAATEFYISEFQLTLQWIPVFYPVIVFDGDLFEAVVKKNDIEINRLNHIVLKYHYIPKSSLLERHGFNGRTMLIDVVTASSIESYSTLIDRESYTMKQLLHIAMQEGRLALPQ